MLQLSTICCNCITFPNKVSWATLLSTLLGYLGFNDSLLIITPIVCGVTGYLNVIPDIRVRSIISKVPKCRFPSNIDFTKCRRDIAAALNDFSNRWYKRENVEPDALKKWKINIFKIIDTRISFYSHNTHLLPPKPKSSFRHLKRGIHDFQKYYVLVPADKAVNNVVVVLRLYYINTLKRELVDTKAYELQPSLSERVVVDGHGCHTAPHFGVKATENKKQSS